MGEQTWQSLWNPWSGLDATLIGGADPTAVQRARIRALNTRRQRREARHAHEVEEEARSAASEVACALPSWLEEALSMNSAALDEEPKAPPRRSNWIKPSPKTDALVAVMQAHPEYTAAQLAREAGCSQALVHKLRASAC